MFGLLSASSHHSPNALEFRQSLSFAENPAEGQRRDVSSPGMKLCLKGSHGSAQISVWGAGAVAQLMRKMLTGSTSPHSGSASADKDLPEESKGKAVFIPLWTRPRGSIFNLHNFPEGQGGRSNCRLDLWIYRFSSELYPISSGKGAPWRLELWGWGDGEEGGGGVADGHCEKQEKSFQLH